MPGKSTKETFKMKSRLLALGGLVAVLGTTTAYGVLAQQGNNIPIAAFSAQRGREKHPELKKALHNLEQAKRNLQNAARDFKGHRAKAEQLTDEAIREVHAAMDADRD